MPLPRSSSKDSPFWGALASLFVLAGAAFVGRELVQDARRRAEASWGEPRPAAFALTGRDGAVVTSASLRGRPYVVSFFFTRCTVTCPSQMEALKKLQTEFAGRGVKLVCISVDGGHDTAEALKAYAASLGAGPDWLFLTGERDAIRKLAAAAFLAGVAENPDEPIGRRISHSSRLFLVDPQGRVCWQTEGLRRTNLEDPDSPLVPDDAALRRLKLKALDLTHGLWLGLADLPHVNAVLNAAAAALLVAGFILIRMRMPAAHAVAMAAAFLVSSLFLVSYLVYHRFAGDTRFSGAGWLRAFYFVLLISHVSLAVATVPLVLLTLRRAFRSDFQGHLKIARWTFPIWLYVSVSGLVVYLFLYQWFPS